MIELRKIRIFSMTGPCTNGVIQSFFPGLLAALVFGELLFYLLKMTIIMVGNFFSYDFTKTYWDIIEVIIPPAATLFFSLLIQRKGDIANMFPDEALSKI